MSSIKYQKKDNEDFKVIEAASLLEFVYNVVGLTENGILPPHSILNEKLLSGGDCNPMGNVDWEPFEIDVEQYEQLCLEIVTAAVENVRSHKGTAFVKLQRAPELDKIVNAEQWSEAVREKYSDEYIEKLMKLNSNESANDKHLTPQHNITISPTENEDFDIPEADWKRVEEIMYEVARDSLFRFAEENKDKIFYALAFDCNSLYGDFLLCANTLDDLERTAKSYKNDHPEWYDDEPIDELMKKLYLSVGDWEYSGFNLDYEPSSSDWKYISDLMESFDELPFNDEALDVRKEASEAFMECACKALLRLDKEGSLNALATTADFQVFCIDHDESEDVAKYRFSKISEAQT